MSDVDVVKVCWALSHENRFASKAVPSLLVTVKVKSVGQFALFFALSSSRASPRSPSSSSASKMQQRPRGSKMDYNEIALWLRGLTSIHLFIPHIVLVSLKHLLMQKFPKLLTWVTRVWGTVLVPLPPSRGSIHGNVRGVKVRGKQQARCFIWHHREKLQAYIFSPRHQTNYLKHYS